MCTFITVALPRNSRFDELRGAFTRAKLGLHCAAKVRPQGILEEEDYFFTATKLCDCGTALGSAFSRPTKSLEHRRRKLQSDLVKRGWSTAKIERRLNDLQHTQEKSERAGAERALEDETELSSWLALINEILQNDLADRIGVAVNEFHGRADQAPHSLRRVETKLGNLTRSTLIEIAPEMLLLVR